MGSNEALPQRVLKINVRSIQQRWEAKAAIHIIEFENRWFNIDCLMLHFKKKDLQNFIVQNSVIRRFVTIIDSTAINSSFCVFTRLFPQT